MAQGLPRPHITWFKDGIELYAHEFFQASNMTVISTVMRFLALQCICYADGTYLHHYHIERPQVSCSVNISASVHLYCQLKYLKVQWQTGILPAKISVKKCRYKISFLYNKLNQKQLTSTNL
jgi:hypothetical protein